MSAHILEKLYEILLARKNSDPASSYTASLYAKGTEKITEKILEEARETIVEALNGNADKLKEESADLLFHLMVLWADQGIAPDDVFAVLEKRFGTGGHTDKAARKN